MALRIEDYAMIGDCETAALVGRDGSIDWLCLPRFDSPACFAALLGDCENGRWRIAPVGEITKVERRYRDGSTILETEFTTADDGVVRLIDFMPLRGKAPDVMRIVEGVRGTVAMHMELILRFDYGKVVPWVTRLDGDRGIRAIAGPDAIYVRTPLKLEGQDFHTVADFTVRAGDRVPVTITWHPSFNEEPPTDDPEQSLAHTEAWWREWSGRCTYKGRWGEAVRRSLVTLKALTFQTTGGIVAAPTTSLPEKIGGTLNWDYRYCWLRDATFTLLALGAGGYLDEARAWREWLVRAIAGDPKDMQIMYSVGGDRRLHEVQADWLAGYEGSKPVRLGNAAFGQRQIDVYGELMDALHQGRLLGLDDNAAAWHIQKQLLGYLEEHWRQPDAGIWETRSGQQHFVHSKVMAWVAFDRAVKSAVQFDQPGDVDHWRKVRDEIHAEVCARGFDATLNSFMQYYGSDHVDASLLMLALVGFLPANDPRIVGTVEMVQRTLLRDGFVMRHPPAKDVDELTSGEGVFLLCTFWLADNLALMGRRAEAEALFERLLGLCNDVGLMSEEYEPQTSRMLGNFPQAFSHIGLINTARNLSNGNAAPAEMRGAQ